MVQHHPDNNHLNLIIPILSYCCWLMSITVGHLPWPQPVNRRRRRRQDADHAERSAGGLRVLGGGWMERAAAKRFFFGATVVGGWSDMALYRSWKEMMINHGTWRYPIHCFIPLHSTLCIYIYIWGFLKSWFLSHGDAQVTMVVSILVMVIQWFWRQIRWFEWCLK